MSATYFKRRSWPETFITDRSQPEPNSGCWLWLRHVNQNGYGTAYFRGKSWLAHRVAYTIFCEEIPPGKVVMHKCDTPLCVNPDHLRIGTHAENLADMFEKGRFVPRGRAITDETVKAILSTKGTYVELGKQFGLCRQTVSLICRAHRKGIDNTGHPVSKR